MGRWDIKWSNSRAADLWIVDKANGEPLALNRDCSDGDFMDAIEKIHNADCAAYDGKFSRDLNRIAKKVMKGN